MGCTSSLAYSNGYVVSITSKTTRFVPEFYVLHLPAMRAYRFDSNRIDDVTAIRKSPDGSVIGVGTYNRLYLIYTAEGTMSEFSWDDLLAMAGDTSGALVERFDINHDGSVVFCVYDDACYHFNPSESTVKRIANGNDFPCFGPYGLVSVDGRRLYVGSLNSGCVTVYDLYEKKLVANIETGETLLNDVIARNGLLAVVKCYDGVRIYNSQLQLQTTIDLSLLLPPMRRVVALSSDGSLLAVVENEDDSCAVRLRVYDTATGREVGSVREHALHCASCASSSHADGDDVDDVALIGVDFADTHTLAFSFSSRSRLVFSFFALSA